MLLLRTVLHALAFYLGSTLLVLAALLALALPGRTVERLAKLWGHYHRACARLFLGQQVMVEGQWPDDAAFYVFKHESMFEAIDTLVLFHRPVVIAKAELLRIPVWGWIAARQGLVGIAREAGPSALKRVMASARKAMAQGRPLCFFPEGTRVPHGERPALKAGFFALYKLMNVPVIPVAVDSGRLYPRGHMRRSGMIRYRIGAPIPPGLPRAEAEAQVHAAINALNSGASEAVNP